MITAERASSGLLQARTGGTMGTAQAGKRVYLLGVVDKDAQRENLVQIEGKVMTICSKYFCV